MSVASSTTSGSSMVTCITMDESGEFDERVEVPFEVLSVSKTFKEMCDNCGIKGQMEGEFPVRVIKARLFRKVIDFCNQTKDLEEPEVKEDPDTKERIWFTFSDYETEFFKMDISELSEILNAASFLNIRRLFLYGCQEAASRIQDQTPDQVRKDWGFEDDLTDTEKKQIRENNLWCNC